MTRCALGIVLLIGLCDACSGSDDPPPPGATAGQVRLTLSDEPVPGAPMGIEAAANPNQNLVGGPCFLLARWTDGEWTTMYNVESGRDEASPVDGGETTCPAIGLTLPHTFSFTMPSDMDHGTWRISYRWHKGGDQGAPAAVVFEVGGP